MTSELSVAVHRRGESVEGAYVRIHGGSGDYVVEQRTGPGGKLKLNLPPGNWLVVAFAPGTPRVVEPILLTLEPKQINLELGD